MIYVVYYSAIFAVLYYAIAKIIDRYHTKSQAKLFWSGYNLMICTIRTGDINEIENLLRQAETAPDYNSFDSGIIYAYNQWKAPGVTKEVLCN